MVLQKRFHIRYKLNTIFNAVQYEIDRHFQRSMLIKAYVKYVIFDTRQEQKRQCHLRGLRNWIQAAYTENYFPFFILHYFQNLFHFLPGMETFYCISICILASYHIDLPFIEVV